MYHKCGNFQNKKVGKFCLTRANFSVKLNRKGDFVKKENDFAMFEYEKVDEDLIDILSNYLEKQAHLAFEFFELEPPKSKVLIKIIPTKKEYDEYYIKLNNYPPDAKLPGWLIGNYIYEKNQITSLSLHDFKNTTHSLKDVPLEEGLDYYQKTIFHEFVHYANGLFRNKHNCGYSAKYLTEGIAAYLSKQHDGKNLKFDFTVEDTLDENKNLYYAYYMLTKYFVENYDKNFVLQTFQSSRQARELLKNELFDKAKQNFENNKGK